MDQVEEGKKEQLHRLLDSYLETHRPFQFQTYPYHLAAIVGTFEASCAAAATFLLTVAWDHLHSFGEFFERNHCSLLMVDQWLRASVFLSNPEHVLADFCNQEQIAVALPADHHLAA